MRRLCRRSYAQHSLTAVEREAKRDYRDVLSPVRDQGRSRFCFSFASVPSFEVSYLKRTGKSVNFSVQQPVDCSPWNTKPMTFDGKDGGCHTFEFGSKYGLATWDDYPLLVPWGRQPCQVERRQCPLYRACDMWAPISQVDSAVTDAVYKHGPVYAEILCTDEFLDYQGGRLQSGDLTRNFATIGAQRYGPCLHAVSIVGYDEQTLIVRNSWGPDFGMAGHALFRRVHIGYGVLEVYRSCAFVDWSDDVVEERWAGSQYQWLQPVSPLARPPQPQPILRRSLQEQFRWFREKYKKAYADGAEEYLRYQLFSQRVEMIQEQNKRAGGRVIFGINKFSDLTPEERYNVCDGVRSSYS